MNKKLHFMHVLFYGLCIVAALWQHGNPYFILFSIVALIAVGTVSPFLKRNVNVWKQLIAITFPCLSGIWLLFRILSGTPSDICIVESLALAGISFFFNLNPRERGYRLIICTVLLVYGAVITRAVYLYALIPATIVLFSLLYLSRLDALSQKPEFLIKPIKSKYELKYLVLHAFIALVLAVFFFTFLSLNKTSDLVSFSFLKDNSSTPTIGDWFLPDNNKDPGEESSFDRIHGKELVNSSEDSENKSSPESFETTTKTDFKKEEYSGMNGLNSQFKESLSSIFEKIKNSWSLFLGVLNGPKGIIIGVMFLLVVTIYFAYPYFKKYFLEMNRKNRCRKTYLKAEASIEKDPDFCLKMCYFTVRSLLDMAGHPRENNLELFEYATSTKVIDPKFCKDVIAVFYLYSKMVYSPDAATRDESKKAFEHLTELRKFLLINRKKVL